MGPAIMVAGAVVYFINLTDGDQTLLIMILSQVVDINLKK